MQAVLGERVPLVMWGPNIQRQVPNAAGRWHVDIESWHWPTVTVVVGLAGCTAGNATRCIAGSHVLSRQPPTTVSDAVALRNARAIDGRCDAICQFEGFGDGFFYVFNARAWHRGDHVAAGERLVLFLHYQLAQDPRVPYMKDYRHGTWFDTPAAHMMVNGSDSCSGVPNDSLYPRPRRKLRGYLALVGWRV
jgi:hypothetical protein